MSFLIVEESLQSDDKLDLQGVRRQLEREFPGSVVHKQEFQEVLGNLELAEARLFAYDVVILDLHQEPEPENRNNALCRLQRSPVTRDAAVFLLKSSPAPVPDDQPHRFPSWSRPKEISILDPLWWTKRLFPAICRVVYESRVERRLDVLFPLRRGEALPLVSYSPRVSGRYGATSFSGTQEVNTLVHDVETHWKYLSPEVRERVKEVFPLEPRGESGEDSVRIKLY